MSTTLWESYQFSNMFNPMTHPPKNPIEEREREEIRNFGKNLSYTETVLP